MGRYVACRAATYLKPVLLELGGKNYAIVLDDADLEQAVDEILEGAFLNVSILGESHYLLSPFFLLT